jgi:hypothetical protein
MTITLIVIFVLGVLALLLAHGSKEYASTWFLTVVAWAIVSIVILLIATATGRDEMALAALASYCFSVVISSPLFARAAFSSEQDRDDGMNDAYKVPPYYIAMVWVILPSVATVLYNVTGAY